MLDLGLKYNITIIKFSSIPPKSPDGSPCDYGVFGKLDRNVKKHQPRSTEGLWKIILKEWEKIPQYEIQNILLRWKFRMRMIVKNGGKHIEHLK